MVVGPFLSDIVVFLDGDMCLPPFFVFLPTVTPYEGLKGLMSR